MSRVSAGFACLYMIVHISGTLNSLLLFCNPGTEVLPDRAERDAVWKRDAARVYLCRW